MYLSAYVMNKETKEVTVIARSDYSSKENFARDLRGNGYTVKRISNNQDIAAQDVGYTSYAELKKYSFNEEKIACIANIEK